MAFKFFILALAIATTVFLSPASAQITTPCTPSMITMFTPCLNFVTNSSTNGTSPSAACCSSLQSLMSSGRDCFCQIATGSIPFQIPINRTLAVSLPRACNMPGVPLQCRAAGAPVPAPAPGPTAFSPSEAPTSVAGLAPPVSPGLAPQADEAQTPPATPTANGGAPTSTTGNRAGVTPSAAQPSYTISPLHLIAVLGAIAFKFY
ncbi:hypothetical protein BUALT_Bualt14G0095500 [Buddleja alternifolia]|uniref:Bifunctional inhibitor/plant lipid transfer protein/seed storage helical domain-containing protein n=1 Tax=Buddleja alternifolia TaxID=168488 RepID=A0AAV6WQ97_9LAMI|nr:hypothetical protein BUALT_Bualt14G0095500 [Buddleja alternifolia]